MVTGAGLAATFLASAGTLVWVSSMQMRKAVDEVEERIRLLLGSVRAHSGIHGTNRTLGREFWRDFREARLRSEVTRVHEQQRQRTFAQETVGDTERTALDPAPLQYICRRGSYAVTASSEVIGMNRRNVCTLLGWSLAEIV